jgi:heme exporter protein D
MWKDFFAAGGWGMYPTSIFGFALLAAAALHALRPDARSGRLAAVLGALTLAAGWLGCAVGISTSAHYLEKVPKPDQLQIFALGCEESLHNVILALILFIVAGLLVVVGTLRGPAPRAAG